MPITAYIRNHKLFPRAYAEGLQQGELIMLRRLIEQRFGTIPDWATQRLAKSSAAELEDLSIRILDARSLEDLLT